MQPGLYVLAVAAAFLGRRSTSGSRAAAHLKLGGRAMLKEWTLSYRRGMLTLSVFVVTAAVLAIIQFGLDGDMRRMAASRSWRAGHMLIL